MPDVGDIVKSVEGNLGRICCVRPFNEACVQFDDGCRVLSLGSLTLADGDAPPCSPECLHGCD